MIWLWDNAETLGTVVMVARRHRRADLRACANRRRSEAERRANAHELWRDTLRLAFDNPKLSDPTLKLAEFDYGARTVDGSIEMFQKYELYVDTILNASEEILEVRRPTSGTPRCASSSSSIATICCRRISRTPAFSSNTRRSSAPLFMRL